jgi:hypothetical protein
MRVEVDEAERRVSIFCDDTKSEVTFDVSDTKVIAVFSSLNVGQIHLENVFSVHAVYYKEGHLFVEDRQLDTDVRITDETTNEVVAALTKFGVSISPMED